MTVFEVMQVALMAVCFTLEPDAMVGFMGIATDGPSHQPLHHIPQVEEDDEHLPLLTGMDALMVVQHRIHPHAMAHEDHAKQVDGRKALDRKPAVEDDHRLLDYIRPQR